MKTPISSAMRAIVFSCFFCICSSLSLKAQFVTIPDTNFVNWLNANGYSQCMNGNQMDTTCPDIVNLYFSVDCSNANIHDLTGIHYFKNLLSLDCQENQLISLPKLPANLFRLFCFNNQLTSLPAVLPSNLGNFACGDNPITDLPPLPASLLYFSCRNNQLTSLPALPAGLRSLSCEDNQLTQLPTLPISLTSLSCDENSLTQLPVLPNSLFSLSCSGNQLTSIPSLPDSLHQLFCRENQLSTLPALPWRLKRLYCNSNQLTQLPALPDSLNEIVCYNNNLTSIPELPDSLTNLVCDNNPNLTCLPQLNFIYNLSFTGTTITCLPNYGSVNFSDPPFNSIPLCDLFNDKGCEAFWNIIGRVYLDTNMNCMFDSSDVGLRQIKLQLWSNGELLQQTFSGDAGFYSFDVDTLGIYEIIADSEQNPFVISCPSNGSHTVVSAEDSFVTGNDFAFLCDTGFDIGATGVIPIGNFRPTQTPRVHIRAGEICGMNGANCADGISGTVTATFTGPASYVSPAPWAIIPTQVNGKTITWDVADFGTLNFQNDFSIVIKIDTFAQSGQVLCFTITVTTPVAGDKNPINNVITICIVIGNSYDPNDKLADPVAEIDTSQEWLTYTVRFQNTGTAEAQHIYIDDTLDTNLDESSIQLLGYSHEPLVQIKDRFVRFNFPNINLPDSTTNEPESHGYVQYKVKLKENLPIGTQIKNTAYIYFDFNAPVVTNTTVNTISLLSSLSNFKPQTPNFSLYPNPASNAFSLDISDELIGSTLTIADITGKNMFVAQLQTENSILETVEFPNGIYFVTLQTREGNSRTKKLIINK